MATKRAQRAQRAPKEPTGDGLPKLTAGERTAVEAIGLLEAALGTLEGMSAVWQETVWAQLELDWRGDHPWKNLIEPLRMILKG